MLPRKQRKQRLRRRRRQEPDNVQQPPVVRHLLTLKRATQLRTLRHPLRDCLHQLHTPERRLLRRLILLPQHRRQLPVDYPRYLLEFRGAVTELHLQKSLTRHEKLTKMTGQLVARAMKPQGKALLLGLCVQRTQPLRQAQHKTIQHFTTTVTRINERERYMNR